MAQFSVNTQRFDRYKNFKFRVKWDGRYVAGVSKVSPIPSKPGTSKGKAVQQCLSHIERTALTSCCALSSRARSR